MVILSKTRTLSCAVLLCLLVAACANEPKPKPPPPINSPVDAFNTVGAPANNAGAPQSDNDTLSRDVRRLQNAHQTYLHAQARHAAEIRRQQANCRARPDSRQVAIRDGSGDTKATYCQRAAGSSGKR